jgi:hypothetical protein
LQGTPKKPSRRRRLIGCGLLLTVVLLSQQKADDYIEVELELDELDLTSAESKATYAEIKDALEHFGMVYRGE